MRRKTDGEAALPQRESGPCPVFAVNLGVRLTPEENSRKKPQSGQPKSVYLKQRWARLVVSTWPPFYERPPLACCNQVTLSLRFWQPGSALGQHKDLPS